MTPPDPLASGRFSQFGASRSAAVSLPHSQSRSPAHGAYSCFPASTVCTEAAADHHGLLGFSSWSNPGGRNASRVNSECHQALGPFFSGAKVRHCRGRHLDSKCKWQMRLSRAIVVLSVLESKLTHCWTIVSLCRSSEINLLKNSLAMEAFTYNSKNRLPM